MSCPASLRNLFALCCAARGAAALCAAALLASTPSPGAEPLAIREIGSFHVGGKEVRLDGKGRERVRREGLAKETVQPKGDFLYGQVYVHFVLLERPTAPYPLVLWPGGSLTGVTYESTPDGREGWQMNFLRAGHSVYTTDAWQTGRANWARFPEISPEEPVFRDAAFLWEIFRIGPPGSFATAPAARQAWPDTRFPTGAFEQFARQAAPRFRLDSELTTAAYDQLLQRVCPCVLLTHSASGPTGYEALQKRPDLIRGLVSIEPSGGIDLTKETASRVARVPQLIVWGDHVTDPGARETWEPLYRGSRRYAGELERAGASVEWLDLPAQGVKGNSHLIMMDANSAEIARLIDQWIRKSVR